ncbi:AraC family transcriptional regulator [Roseiarcus fermentans]|uniref:AraC family transcriptional regulator n=1 Tax=Roseiarcus fermentans TaxID=1473586 RepID=A0A366FD43_9HYPH|nr:AraC family transcriptional regulator [Roseiarcus fermentans]RBP12006.1 AraC family transcriptional regulator [Roseiarcus fermentans]
MSARFYPPYKLSVLAEVMGDFGCPKPTVLHGTGLDPASVDDPRTRTSIEQYLTACANVLRFSREPAIPFLVGKKLHLSAYGAYGFALLCSGTARESFTLALQYHSLATPVLAIDWYENAEHFIWTSPAETRLLVKPDLKQFILAQQLSQHYIHVKEVVGGDVTPLRAEFALPKPETWRVFEEHLECPVFFDRPRTELVYPKSVLDVVPPMTNRVTATLMRENCESLLGQSDALPDIAGEVFRMMMDRPGRFPTIEDVADALGMTDRTLQRRLSAQNKTFSDIFDDVRKVLALEYLKSTQASVEEIAELLGFANAANFRKSFRRWTGKRPSACRSAP